MFSVFHLLQHYNHSHPYHCPQLGRMTILLYGNCIDVFTCYCFVGFFSNSNSSTLQHIEYDSCSLKNHYFLLHYCTILWVVLAALHHQFYVFEYKSRLLGPFVWQRIFFVVHYFPPIYTFSSHILTMLLFFPAPLFDLANFFP